METRTQKQENPTARRDIHQQVTDTIIKQLEQGTVPWQKPWKGDDNRFFGIPQNFTTGKKYRGINILLLWSSAIGQGFKTQEWASFKQWQEKKEAIRKGEKGSMVVYYDTIEREVDGELKKIPFIKSSVVFNRCQLASYTHEAREETQSALPLVQRIEQVDNFITNTKAIIEHKNNTACYIPSADKINMPVPEAFIDTQYSTATEGYYSTLLHELTHWTGSKERLNRQGGKKFGDANYAAEELVAELGAAFLCAQFEITEVTKTDHASYIGHWLERLKENNRCIFTASSEASKACDYLDSLQPKKPDLA